MKNSISSVVSRLNLIALAKQRIGPTSFALSHQINLQQGLTLSNGFVNLIESGKFSIPSETNFCVFSCKVEKGQKKLTQKLFTTPIIPFFSLILAFFKENSAFF